MDYNLTAKDLEVSGIEGLKVPNIQTLNGHMFVYFKKDIQWLALRKQKDKVLSQDKASFQNEKRRHELIELLERRYGVKDVDFQKQVCSDYGIGQIFINGKSKRTADKVAQMIAKAYNNCKRSGKGANSKLLQSNNVIEINSDYEDENELQKLKGPSASAPQILQEMQVKQDSIGNLLLPSKRTKQLNESDQKLYQDRKQQLTERLVKMKIQIDKINFDEVGSFIHNWLIGKSKKDVGKIAGAIWRQNKPIFTGVRGLTTQRIVDQID